MSADDKSPELVDDGRHRWRYVKSNNEKIVDEILHYLSVLHHRIVVYHPNDGVETMRCEWRN